MKSTDDHFDWDEQVLNRWSRQNKTMPVDFINGYGSELPIRPASARPATSVGSAAAASDSFATTDAFNSAQNQAAASRPEKIARASELLADGDYPSDKVLNQLAGFLAGKL
jgi:hypothetical protein